MTSISLHSGTGRYGEALRGQQSLLVEKVPGPTPVPAPTGQRRVIDSQKRRAAVVKAVEQHQCTIKIAHSFKVNFKHGTTDMGTPPTS